MLLFQSGAEAIDAGVAVKKEGPQIVLNGVPVRKNENRRLRELFEELPYGFLHVLGEVESGTLFEQRGEGANALGQVLKEGAVIA